ncbi:MAG TPA: hypothetical protein DD653_01415 [Marinilabiliales bacterium]|jgi:hypothetical protein|nr:MAG: hypothetical protein A2W84_15990 [Bacteroidetes bacterium GWC2_40_13]HAZ02027.1 hypothetical protein [Marinilabiliales bacterium]HBO73330.1 hypothetical protein [Marinilabiliales bacterium]
MEAFFKFGENYINEVIKPLIPNANLGWFINRSYYLFGPGLFNNSIYERKLDEESYFFHFTSISSLLDIIRSKTIRMSDFNSFSDNFELTYANNNLVENPSEFKEYKSCLFALSMCEESVENLQNDYLWENYGDNHRGVCIKLKFVKQKSILNDFYLGKIIYKDTNQILELEELKKRHKDFENKYGEAIDNLDEILLTVCSMYKKAIPYKDENEIRLLAYIHKSENYIHTNSRSPIRHKYNSKKDLIEYFLELELESEIENENKDKRYCLPYLSIDSIILGSDCFRESISKLRRVIEYEFEDSFKRELIIYYK